MQLELSDEACEYLCALAYAKWSSAFDNLKQVKDEIDDGSNDWVLFHTERLRRATIEVERSQRVLDEIKKYSPLLRQLREKGVL